MKDEPRHPWWIAVFRHPLLLWGAPPVLSLANVGLSLMMGVIVHPFGAPLTFVMGQLGLAWVTRLVEYRYGVKLPTSRAKREALRHHFAQHDPVTYAVYLEHKQMRESGR